MKIPMAIAGAVLLGGVLTACGGSDGGSGGGGGGNAGSSYCKDLKKAASTFGNLGAGDTASIGDAFATFKKLSGEAPSAVKSDWKTLETAITTLETALADAGIKMEDLAKIQAGQIPEGVDMTKLSGLAPKLQQLSGPEFDKASKAIEAHAKSVCKVDLNKVG